GLRAMGQRDPLVEYQREGYHLFQAMNEAIKEESVQYLFNLEVRVQQPGAEGEAAEGRPAAGVTEEAAAQTAAAAPFGATAGGAGAQPAGRRAGARSVTANRSSGVKLAEARSEEHTSELQSRENLVC